MEINRPAVNQIIDISRRAGDAILAVYQRDDVETSEKEDRSPLTEADLASHRIIVDALADLTPEIPILSEEGELPNYDERSLWQRYWIIDPLDGTKEFIKRNGEFTVNIALIEQGVPVLGVVMVPVLDICYAGAKSLGAFKLVQGNETPIHIKTIADKSLGEPLNVVASRSHVTPELEACVNRLARKFGEIDRQSMGSSLKLCLVAEGAADIYPRLAPTSEWDTAAAQAVVEAAGGVVLDESLRVLRYNAKADILNPYFYVLGDTDYDWSAVL